MEFGLGAGLPLYAGGLGILAGDFLKTASDLGIPVIGVGLLYQEGYFRQIIDALGAQHEPYPFNDPGPLPIEPAPGQDGSSLRIALDLPGRTLSLRVWQAQVGRVRLYLLDTNDPRNSPSDPPARHPRLPPKVAQAADVLDPIAPTLGLARRFTGYKRPNLLLRDPARLARLLNDSARPVQLVLAGKAHPADDLGKEMIRQWIDLAQRPEFRRRLVFLKDYDIAVAQELVQGIDVWVNTPRRPWEACGTSGMKVLVNGGPNVSERDGWWDYAPEIGDGLEHPEAEADAADAQALYAILEQEVVPEFYARDAAGLPRRWLARVRRSMASLTPTYRSSRMARDYVEQYYLIGAAELRRRTADEAKRARAITKWESRLRKYWPELDIGKASREPVP
jgi:glucan phosphorylase